MRAPAEGYPHFVLQRSDSVRAVLDPRIRTGREGCAAIRHKNTPARITSTPLGIFMDRCRHVTDPLRSLSIISTGFRGIPAKPLGIFMDRCGHATDPLRSLSIISTGFRGIPAKPLGIFMDRCGHITDPLRSPAVISTGFREISAKPLGILMDRCGHVTDPLRSLSVISTGFRGNPSNRLKPRTMRPSQIDSAGKMLRSRNTAVIEGSRGQRLGIAPDPKG